MNAILICIFYEVLFFNNILYKYSNFNYLVTVLEIFVTIYYYGARNY